MKFQGRVCVEKYPGTARVRKGHKELIKWMASLSERSLFRRKTEGCRKGWEVAVRDPTCWLWPKREMGEGFRASYPIISQCSHGHCSMTRAEGGEQIPLGFLPLMSHPVLLFTNVLTIRVRCGWLCNRNHPTLSVNQMGNNTVFTRKQVGNSSLHKKSFAILQRTPHDLLSSEFSQELFKVPHTHLYCRVKRKEQEPCFLPYCTLHKALIASNSLHGFDFITLKWVILVFPTVPKRTE